MSMTLVMDSICILRQPCAVPTNTDILGALQTLIILLQALGL